MFFSVANYIGYDMSCHGNVFYNCKRDVLNQMASCLNTHSPFINTSLLNIQQQQRMTVPLSGVLNQTAWHCAVSESSVPNENLLRIDSQNEQQEESCVPVAPPSTSWTKRKASEDRAWAVGREWKEYVNHGRPTKIQLLEAC